MKTARRNGSQVQASDAMRRRDIADIRDAGVPVLPLEVERLANAPARHEQLAPSAPIRTIGAKWSGKAPGRGWHIAESLRIACVRSRIA
jgi:hypothetical protein